MRVNKLWVLIVLVMLLMLVVVATSTQGVKLVGGSSEERDRVRTDNQAVLEKSSYKKVKFFIVNSYDLNDPCTGPQLIGIEETCSIPIIEKFKLDPDFFKFYMETKTTNREEFAQTTVAAEAIRRIEELNPDYIITTDDDAFRLVGIPMANKGRKVFATGINKSYKDYKKEYKIEDKNVIAVEELISLDQVIKLFDKTKFLPQTYYILYDDSETSVYMTKNYLDELSGKCTVERHQVNDVTQLRKLLSYLNGKPRGVLILNFQRLRGEDGKTINKYDTLREVFAFNKKHIELGGNPIYSKFGVAITCAPDFFTMGRSIGAAILEVIESGKFVHKEIRAVSEMAINTKRLHQLDAEFLIRTSLDFRVYDSY